MSSPVNFEVDQFAILGNEIVVIEDIRMNELGFRQYSVVGMNTGIRRTVNKSQLSPHDSRAKFLQAEWDEEIVFELKNEEKDEEKENVQCRNNRYAVVSEEEMNQIAKERLSVNTEKQTRWSVKLLKGESN